MQTCVAGPTGLQHAHDGNMRLLSAQHSTIWQQSTFCSANLDRAAKRKVEMIFNCLNSRLFVLYISSGQARHAGIGRNGE